MNLLVHNKPVDGAFGKLSLPTQTPDSSCSSASIVHYPGFHVQVFHSFVQRNFIAPGWLSTVLVNSSLFLPRHYVHVAQ